MWLLSIKVPIQKKSGNLFYYPHIRVCVCVCVFICRRFLGEVVFLLVLLYIYIYIYIYNFPLFPWSACQFGRNHLITYAFHSIAVNEWLSDDVNIEKAKNTHTHTHKKKQLKTYARSDFRFVNRLTREWKAISKGQYMNVKHLSP